MSKPIGLIIPPKTPLKVAPKTSLKLPPKPTILDIGKKMLFDDDVLTHVRNFGEARLPKVGGLVAEKIALAVVSRLLPKIRRSSGVKVRSRLNLLLHWYPGWGKTTLVNDFIENLIPYTQTVSTDKEWMWVNATDISRAKLRGSFEGSSVVPPLAHFADIITIGELMQFVGYGDKGREMIAWLDGALEERTGTVGFVKAVNVEQEEIDYWKNQGIHIDPITKLMIYEVPSVFIGCIADITTKEYRVINPAFFSRWDINSWNPTDQELKDAYKQVWEDTPIKQCNIEGLRAVYGLLKQVKIGAVEEPSLKWLSQIHKDIIDKAEYISNKGNIPIDQLINLRDWGDCIRIMACHALYRQWQRYSGMDFQFELSKLVWENEDKEYLLKHLDALISTKLIRLPGRKKPDIDNAVLQVVSEEGPITREKIDEILTKQLSCSSDKIWRALKRLEATGKITHETYAHGKFAYKIPPPLKVAS